MQKLQTKKLLYIIGGGVVLLGVVLYSVFANLKKPTPPLSWPQSGVATSVQSTAGTTSGAKKPAATPLAATKSYLDALKAYKNTGYYFQFVDCHGSPGFLTLKKGKKFMLDNRDGVARKIHIQGGQTFNIAAYGFAIATAPSTLGEHYIDCNGGGAAKILVQQ